MGSGAGAGRASSRSIAFLVDRWDPARGGAERALAQLARHLELRGHDVHAFGLAAAADAPGRFHAVDPGGLPLRAAREARLGPALVAAARRAGCERTVGLRHLPECDLYWPHGGAHLASLEARARARGRPLGRLSARQRVFLGYERALLDEGGARRIACVSELVRGELARLHPACAERLVLVPNAVDLARFAPERREGAGRDLRAALGVAAGEPLLALVARDPRLKGLPVLLEALAGLRERPWRLVVAGPRRPRPWQRAADRRLGRGRAAVAAWLPAEALHAAADLVVLPTWRDTSSLVVLEALASGTPVVTTALAGEAALVDEGAGTVLAAPEAGALREALAGWLDRLARGGPDRAALRARVADRGLGPWLARLEELVLEG